MSAASSPISIVMTPESDSGSLIAESPPRLDTSQQSLEYRAMVRRLLERYSRPEIERLFEEEGCDYTSSCGQQPGFSWNDCLEGYVAVPDEGALTSEMAGAPSEILQQQHEQQQEQQQQQQQQDLAPAAASQQALLSPQAQPQKQPQKQSGRNMGALALRTLLPSAVNVFPAKPASPTSRPKSPRSTARDSTQRNDYACGFCAEVGIPKTCTRRNDLRRHMDQFHNTNAQWLCQHPGCDLAFDWPTAYQIHLRTAHGGSQMMRMADARVDLCAQTVFACGFQGCNQIFEAQNSGPSIALAWKTFTGHLIRHCDRGTAVRWDYSHRMRNLLRQTKVAVAWAEADAQTPGLKWNPVSSRILRKVLETRHVDDLSGVMSAVVALGSDDDAFTADLQAHLELPVRKRCIFAKGGHSEASHRCKSASPCSLPASSPPPRPSSSSSSESDAGTLTQPFTGLLPQANAAHNPHLMSGYQEVPENASFNSMAGLSFPSYSTDYTSSSGLYTAPQFIGHTQLLAMPSVLAAEPPVVFYQEMPMAVPRAQEGWDQSFVPTGLQSPALTDASFLDLAGSPMSTPTQQPDMLEGLVVPSTL